MTDIIQEIPEIRNAKWNSLDHISFDVELNHPEYGWIPFTVCESQDEESYAYKLWSIKDTLDIQEYVEPVKSLEEIKQELLSQIAQESDKFEQNKCDSMFITSSLGFRANADRRSLQNIDNLIFLNEPTLYKDYDNQFHQLSVSDLNTLRYEISKNGANLYTQKFLLQSQVMEGTLETLEDFEVQFEMMDFSED